MTCYRIEKEKAFPHVSDSSLFKLFSVQMSGFSLSSYFNPKCKPQMIPYFGFKLSYDTIIHTVFEFYLEPVKIFPEIDNIKIIICL